MHIQGENMFTIQQNDGGIGLMLEKYGELG